MMEKANIRQRFLGLLGDYWWALLLVVIILTFTTGISIFQYILWGVGVFFALVIFAPFLFQLFAPAFILISTLTEHFRDSKGQSSGKRYIFIPATLLAIAGFVTAQIILSIWVLILSVLIWAGVIGFVFTFIGMFFFGLAPFAMIGAPFVIWVQLGFAEFLGVGFFFLVALLWNGFSKMLFSEDYLEATPGDYLGYSPHTFLLGALSFQVISLPLYNFGFNGAGNLISDAGGALFLLLALISAYKWRAIKKSLPKDEREALYKPSAWIYVLGLLLTSGLYAEFEQVYSAPTAILFWLNSFFFVALVARLFGLFRRKKKEVPKFELS